MKTGRVDHLLLVCVKKNLGTEFSSNIINSVLIPDKGKKFVVIMSVGS